MPQTRVAGQFVPWRDTRHRCVQQHQLFDDFRMPCRKCIGDLGAEIVTDYQGTRMPGPKEQLPYVFRQRVVVVTAGGPGTVAQSAQVDRDDRVVPSQFGHDAVPGEPGLRPAVKKDQRRTLAAYDIVQTHPVHIRAAMGEHLIECGLARHGPRRHGVG